MFGKKTAKEEHYAEVRQRVIAAGEKIAKTGLIERKRGNLSALGAFQEIGDRYIFITGTGRDHGHLTDDDVVRVRLFDLSWKGKTEPSSETLMHRELYRVRNDAKVIIHTHQLYASVLGCGAGRSLHLDIGDDRERVVLISEYGHLENNERVYNVADAAAHLPDSLEPAEGITRHYAPVVIMRHHGVVVWSEDFDSAIHTATLLEKACKTQLIRLEIPTDGREALERYMEVLMEEEKDEKVIPMEIHLDDCAKLVGDTARIVEGKLRYDVRPGEEDIAQDLLERNAMAALTARAMGHNIPLPTGEVKVLYEEYGQRKK